MDYKIVEKAAFKVVGLQQSFTYDEAQTAVPKLWSSFHQRAGQEICPMYGINTDLAMAGNTFEYLIADDYHETKAVPEGFFGERNSCFHLGSLQLSWENAGKDATSQSPNILRVVA